MTAPARRLLVLAIVALAFCVGFGLYIGLFLTTGPGQASAAAQRTPGSTNLYLATVAAAETSDPHPTWVSYYAVDAQSRNWRHATTYTVPAHTVVHVTIYQYDGQSGLRNGFLGQSTGTIGGSFLLNGKPTRAIPPDAASHVFAIPQFGLSVPLMGISDSAKNPCANAPCPLSTDHETIQFSFKTPGPGLYRWQCFVPCAAGYIEGFGGPMQTVGYMDGFIKVV